MASLVINRRKQLQTENFQIFFFFFYKEAANFATQDSRSKKEGSKQILATFMSLQKQSMLLQCPFKKQIILTM